MFTFKEALCLLAVVAAYGIAGRMDYEDALLEQARRRADAACAPPGVIDALPPKGARPDPNKAVHAPPEEAPGDEACAQSRP